MAAVVDMVAASMAVAVFVVVVSMVAEDISAVSAAVAFTAAISAASAPHRPFMVAAIATADFATMAVFIGIYRPHYGYRHFHRRYYYGGYYPYYHYPRRCRVIWTYYGPRRVCRWHRWHYPYRYW